jgi:hypothetical protein
VVLVGARHLGGSHRGVDPEDGRAGRGARPLPRRERNAAKDDGSVAPMAPRDALESDPAKPVQTTACSCGGGDTERRVEDVRTKAGHAVPRAGRNGDTSPAAVTSRVSMAVCITGASCQGD